jgi:hypothetical protein
LPLQEFVPGDFEDSDSFAENNSSAHVFYLQHRKEREQIEESGNSQVTSMVADGSGGANMSKKPITGIVIGLTDIALDLSAGFSVWDERGMDES